MHIFITALDWGLGHTTRLFPIAKKLSCEGHTLIIGATNAQRILFSEYFPDAHYVSLPSYQPLLSRRHQQFWAIAQAIPRFVLNSFRERFITRQIVKKYGIGKIVSDNRYTVYSSKAESILITHQLNVLLPRQIKFLQPLVRKFIHRQINRFDKCFVPDYPGEYNLTGELNYPLPKLRCPVQFIGPLSRLSLVKESLQEYDIPDLLIIVSGPEKQRTEFEQIILKTLKPLPDNRRYLIVRGLPQLTQNNLENSLAYADAPTLKTLIKQAKFIICRSGYSTIMDLLYMKKTALLIPTPGQTEQEYLAKHLSGSGLFLSATQQEPNIKYGLKELEQFTPANLFYRSKNPGERWPFEDFF